MVKRQAADDEARETLQMAAEEVIQAQLKSIALPRRFSLPMREIWDMQMRLAMLTGKRTLRLLNHPRFRAGYDFLLLRVETDAEAAQLAQWWTQFLALDEAARGPFLQGTSQSKPRRRRQKRTPRTRPASLPVN
jgi:poly(A) polymerase